VYKEREIVQRAIEGSEQYRKGTEQRRTEIPGKALSLNVSIIRRTLHHFKVLLIAPDTECSPFLLVHLTVHYIAPGFLDLDISVDFVRMCWCPAVVIVGFSNPIASSRPISKVRQGDATNNSESNTLYGLIMIDPVPRVLDRGKTSRSYCLRKVILICSQR
jgi:hypothetical protein